MTLFGFCILVALSCTRCGRIWGGVTWSNGPSPVYLLAVPYFASNSVALFSINSANGNLTEMSGSPYNMPSSNTPRRGEFSSTYNIFFAGDNTALFASAFLVNPLTGQFALGSASPIALPAGPDDFAFTTNGLFAYAVYHNANKIGQYSINPTTGNLTSLGADFVVNPTCMIPTRALIDKTQQYLYLLCNGTNNIVPYTISPTTGLVTGALAPFVTGNAPADLVIDPVYGQYLYEISPNTPFLYALQIQGTGALIQVGGPGYETANLAAGTQGIAIDPTSRFVYVVNQTGSINAYLTDAVNGVDYVGTYPITGGTGARGVVVDPTGHFVYVSNATSGNLTIFQINEQTGGLTVVNPAFQTLTMVGSSPQYMTTFTP